MEINSIVALIGLMISVAGFTEWRIRMIHAQFREKLEDVDKVNKVIQNGLETKIERLETKIDMLIDLNLRKQYDQKRPE